MAAPQGPSVQQPLLLSMRPMHFKDHHLTQDYQEVKKVEEIFNLPVNIFYNEKKRNPYT
jgi:hypothetical protein